jgi:hypothetical protein
LPPRRFFRCGPGLRHFRCFSPFGRGKVLSDKMVTFLRKSLVDSREGNYLRLQYGGQPVFGQLYSDGFYRLAGHHDPGGLCGAQGDLLGLERSHVDAQRAAMDDDLQLNIRELEILAIDDLGRFGGSLIRHFAFSWLLFLQN